MENQSGYVARLQREVERAHKCDATYRDTVSIPWRCPPLTEWKPAAWEVVLFELSGHSTAKRCYAWIEHDGPLVEDERVVALLESPVVESAQSAIRFQINKDLHESMSNFRDFMKAWPKPPLPSN